MPRFPGRVPPRRGTIALLAAALLAVPLTLTVPSASAAASSASTPWPASPSWQSLDETPTSSAVCPVAVVSTSGTVSGAGNLVCGGSGGATLTLASGGATPTVVLDYGKEVGGIPTFTVTAESGSPTLRAGYSESERNVSATGDADPPWAEGDPQRYDDYSITGAGTITDQYVQGGERYEEITLTSPGTVTLGAAGITYIADRTQASALPGWFDSSNAQFNQIWYDSEYTDQIDSVPAQSLPSAWTVTGGALQAGGTSQGTNIGLVTGGSSWGSYTASFQTDVVSNQAGWVVRGQDENDGYVFILNDSADTSGTPNSLQELDLHNGNYTSLGTVTLPTALTAGTWHTVSTTVSGSTITVSLDGTQLTSLTDSTYASGTVGFREYTGESAAFKNLTVTSSSGSTLFSNSLGSSSALADFSPLPGQNSYASILDGAKRDRAIWVGDMNVEIPSVSYSTDNAAYLKGSLEALGSYQLSSGFVTGDLPPQTPLATTQQTGTTGSYSASYSIYFVLGLADYYLYSGDTAFVDQELSVLKGELAWNATQLDANGLLTTNSSDNADWDFYDAGKNGEVTEYNVLYYEALLDGATLANAAGDSSDAATYTSDAAALKTAINAHLYNSGTGLYDLSNQDTGTIAQDANALAVLYGVAPASDDAAILAALKTDLWTTSYGPKPFSGSSYADTVSPYISGYELDARLATNDTADAESLLSTVWGHMISAGQDTTGTMWENVSGSTGQPGLGSSTSESHGWSTTPVSALSGYVLGAQPATAGYATWTVQPHPGDLAWAEGSVPTPHGAIGVDWAGESGVGQFSMQVTAPSGTSGTIAVPTYGAADPIVAVNGNTVWSGGTFTATTGISGAHADSSYVYLTGVQPGTYTVAANPGSYGVPTGYTKCAAEGATCTVTGTESVAYGANGIYAYTTTSSSVACTDAALTDPDYGIVKSCYVGQVTSGPSGQSTTYCAPENALCSFTGTKTVYYGAGSSWTSKAITNGATCNNAVFGDPDYGVVKACLILD
ncbi:MAG TPA: alpha-L-rhamnosidase C-terminal domain-containing protein [Actinospica sp.]|jgi:alpha-L-rhamnosidase|nr:alpha-L-rhamnosidase C-terminal domain-containing protein [Actinospica sp.]